MVFSVPTAMPLKSKLSEAGDQARFRKTFTGQEVGWVTSKVPSNSKLL